MWVRSLVGWLVLALLGALPAQAGHGGHVGHARPHHRAHPLPQNERPNSEFVKGKICIGTNGRMSVPSNRQQHYKNMRDRFTNCTYVDGNLELTWLDPPHSDLSFLQHIREVTGYVLIFQVNVVRIVLPELQIIRGRILFTMNVRKEKFALMVTMCQMHSLELPALRDVLSGSVAIYNNYNLCHIKTINWDEIITGPDAKYIYTYAFNSVERECSKCHENCTGGCWGEGSENCQKFSKTNCSPQCWQGRCFGSNPRECCHLFCAGGCKGPKQSDCLACRNFYDDGLCTQECPPMQRYNPTTYSWEANPGGKYAYGATCVRNCPEHLLKDNGACVRSCPPKKTAVNGECVPCDGPCPKTCVVVAPVHSGNIDSFKDCTIIDGSLEILEHSFKGFQNFHTNLTIGGRFPKMHPDRLEVFSTLKEVTGYINIQGYHEDFKNLSYFRNLEVIGGRELVDNFFASLYIVKTSLSSLSLKSLNQINSGCVAILENKNLCFAQNIQWDKIKKSTEHKALLMNNKNEEDCKREGLVCESQCSSDGCWGSGSDQCLSCRSYQFADTCLESCDTVAGIYKSGPRMCKQCHEECESTCSGPGQEDCAKCKHARDGPFCVPQCPTTKYRSELGECLHCHENCVDGCLGPDNNIGATGCNSCEKAIINCDVTVERCLQKNETCPDGYYYEWVGPQEQGPLKPLAGKAICRKCHPRCKKCTGYGFHEQVCQECTKFKRGEQCEDECPQDHYADEETQICVPCNMECRGCVGPDVFSCIKCRNFKIFLDGEPSSDNSTAFNCTATCPPDMPHKIFPNEMAIEPYCSVMPVKLGIVNNNAQISLFLFAIITIGILTVITLSIIGIICRQKANAKQEALKMTLTRQMTGCDSIQPLQPSGMQPNLNKLRIVKHVELRIGDILGFGAFGKVFKGVWVPEGENVKIPVAIKVLRDGTGNNTKEFLAEAYIMATVEHPNLLQLLAVCMTSQMMLITQLMPSGCLLDYVRIHKEKIGSKAMLNWCMQIARGMAYLEEKRLVHRDLAARNVLVQTASCVKITDFGLAKLLDIDVDVYKAEGGKMPIKWLALECIQHRIFTHKSDVWAFGVTIWELLTYGGRPYENIPARDVPELIENGLKLPQPAICSLDIYCIMVNCWMLDAGSRPNFKNMAEKFSEMAKDPGRYLAIQGDKYMKLTGYMQPDDVKDVIKNLTASESADTYKVEDEYMQPKYREIAILPNSNSAGSNSSENPTILMNKPCSSNSWQRNTTVSPTESFPLQGISTGSNTWEQNMDRYPRMPDIKYYRRQYCNAGLMHSDGSSSRYCTDPKKMGSKEDTSDDTSKEAQVGDIKLDLPLDEDDYLMPSPQQNPSTTYMDLIGESIGTENHPKYPDFLETTKQGVDNPEYLLSSPEELTDASETNVDASRASGSPEAEPESPVTFVAERLVEDESISDHEYYNDLQRELQPLKRNETTV